MSRSPFPVSLAAVWNAIAGRVRWIGEWTAGTYQKNDFGWEGPFSGVALIETTDHIAPQNVGAVQYVYQDTLIDDSVTVKQLTLGQRYHLTFDAVLSGYRVYTVVGNHYIIYVITDPLGVPVVEQVANFIANIDGWTEIAIDPITVRTGVTFDLVAVINEPDPTPVQFNGDWNYITPNNPAQPASGQIIHPSKDTQTLSVSATDDIGGNRRTELLTLTVGDTIEGVGQDWSIQGISDQVTFFDFTVAPATQGFPNGVSDFVFSTVATTPITFGEDVDHWVSELNVDGIYSETGYSNATIDDSQYIVDVEYQEIEYSPDWDLLPINQSQGGSGQPVNPFGAVYKTEPLAAPITITEGDPPVEIISLSIPTPEPGTYQAALNFIGEFTSAGDTLDWEVTGTFPSGSPPLRTRSNKNDEKVAFGYPTIIELNGSPVTVGIEVSIDGPGAATIDITTANIFFVRVQ